MLRIKNIILSLLAFIALWLGYVKFITVVGYAGFIPDINKLKIVESLFFTILIAALLPTKIKKISDFLIYVHFLLPILPMLVLYGAQDFSRKYLFFTVTSFLLLNYIRHFKIPKIKNGLVNLDTLIKIIFFIILVYIIGVIFFGGLKYLNFNFLNVYLIREESAKNLPSLFSYFTPSISKVFIPLMVAISLYKKKYLYTLLGIFSGIMVFGLTAHKGPMFYPLLVFFIYKILDKRSERLTGLLFGGYLLSIIAPIVIYFINDSFFAIGSFSFRRVYFVPALLNFFYYDFFSSNPLVLLSESKLTLGLVDYPYSLNSSRLIAYLYTKGSLTTGGANTGWIGSSYMNFGFSGMLLYTFIIGLLFSICDELASKKGRALIGSSIFIPIFILFTSSDLPTAMLNHGVILSLLVILALKIKHEKNRSLLYNT